VLSVRGDLVALDGPIDWSTAAASVLQRGEESLALLRQAQSDDAVTRALALIDSWIDHNPLASAPGWEFAIVARRLACWSAAFSERRDGMDGAALERWAKTLFLQARWLHSNIDLTGEQTLSALRALLGAGAAFTGVEPNSWRDGAARRLVGEIDRHIGADGGHSLRRPDEQLRIAADLLDATHLIAVESEAARRLRERLPLVVELAAALCHPDGRPAGFGGAPEVPPLHLADIQTETEGEGFCFRTFRDAGYTTFTDRSHGDAVLVDWRGRDSAAPFSAVVEASFDGHRMLMSPAASDGRARNGVLVDGSACPGRHARLDEVVWGRGPGFAYLGIESHDGGRALYRRLLAFEGRALMVVDRVWGSERRAVSRLLLAPDVRIDVAGPRRLYLEWPGRSATLAWLPGADIRTEEIEVADADGALRLSTAIDVWVPGGGERLIGWVLAHGRRRDTQMDVIDADEERLGVRFDPRRYYIAWERGGTPRVLFAD